MCNECNTVDVDLIKCGEIGCEARICPDLTQECGGKCDDCDVIACWKHASEYEECSCLVCDACKAKRKKTCNKCSRVYEYQCGACPDFMDFKMILALEGHEESDLCHECFLRFSGFDDFANLSKPDDE